MTPVKTSDIIHSWLLSVVCGQNMLSFTDLLKFLWRPTCVTNFYTTTYLVHKDITKSALCYKSAALCNGTPNRLFVQFNLKCQCVPYNQHLNRPWYGKNVWRQKKEKRQWCTQKSDTIKLNLAQWFYESVTYKLYKCKNLSMYRRTAIYATSNVMYVMKAKLM